MPKCVILWSRGKLCINRDVVGNPNDDNDVSVSAIRIACKKLNEQEDDCCYKMQNKSKKQYFP